MINFRFLKEEYKKDFNKEIFKLDLNIKLIKSIDSKVIYNFIEKSLTFYYKDEFEVNRLILETFNEDFSHDFIKSINRTYESTSFMVDCARNNVLRVDTFKKLIRYISLMGFDTLKIYLEDCFEVLDEPYFGHFRGKLSINELKEIVEYASDFNLKVVPCIQTLAHLNSLTKWCVYRSNFDIDDILLVDSDETYRLIENMFRTIDLVFDTEVVNIGMDEAHKLGRGKYLDLHGYHERLPILVRHLKKVLEIANRHGYKCEMRGDLFFNNQEFVTNYQFDDKNMSLVSSLDDSLKLIYWDYNNQDEEIFIKNIKEHKKIKDDITIAGGAWKWLGYAPNNSYSMGNIRKFFFAGKKENIKEFTLTGWGDNGGETSIFAVLPSLNYLETLNYHSLDDKNYLFKELTDLDVNDYLVLDHLNAVRYEFKEEDKTSLSRIYLFNDILLGIYDSCVKDEQSEIYKKVAKDIKNIGFDHKFGYVFKTLYDLSDLLTYKVDIGIKLRKAYKNKDYKELNNLIKVLKKIKTKLVTFNKDFYYQWSLESKSFGFDVQDLRLGGLKERIDKAIFLLTEFVNKNITQIDELEEDILDFYGQVNIYYKPDDLVDCRYSMMSTVNINW